MLSKVIVESKLGEIMDKINNSEFKHEQMSFLGILIENLNKLNVRNFQILQLFCIILMFFLPGRVPIN